MTCFTNLPFELLQLIATCLDRNTLLSWSVVNLRCRLASEKELFHTVKVTFTEKGLDTLEQLSKSPQAALVRTLHYDASELIDQRLSLESTQMTIFLTKYTVVQQWDYFSSCIYTAQDYARDYKDLYWNMRGQSFCYRSIHHHFKRVAYDQWQVIEKRKDIKVFQASLPRLKGLKNIRISFTGNQEEQLIWFSNRIFISFEESYAIHLEAVFSGMAASQRNGLAIESMEVDGIHSSFPTMLAGLVGTAQDALMPISFFKLTDSPGFMELLSAVTLPSLDRLYVMDCWLVGSELRRFLETHNALIEHVEFRRISLLYERFTGDRRCQSSVVTFWETVSETGNTGKIETLVVKRS